MCRGNGLAMIEFVVLSRLPDLLVVDLSMVGRVQCRRPDRLHRHHNPNKKKGEKENSEKRMC